MRWRAPEPGACGYFDNVVSVDLASAMIDLDRDDDRSSGRCTFVLLQGQDLRELERASFDFAYTAHVLQHTCIPNTRDVIDKE